MPSSFSAFLRSALASSPSSSGQTRLSKAIMAPSGLHFGLLAPVDRSVTCCASPGPVMSITKIWASASSSSLRLAENAIAPPSGRQSTPDSPEGVAVSRRGGSEPSMVTSQRSETSSSSS